MITKNDFCVLFHHLDSNPWRFPLARDKFESTRELFFERFKNCEIKTLSKTFDSIIDSEAQERFPDVSDVYRWLRVVEEPKPEKKIPPKSKEERKRIKQYLQEARKIVLGNHGEERDRLLGECWKRFKGET